MSSLCCNTDPEIGSPGNGLVLLLWLRLPRVRAQLSPVHGFGNINYDEFPRTTIPRDHTTISDTMSTLDDEILGGTNIPSVHYLENFIIEETSESVEAKLKSLH